MKRILLLLLPVLLWCLPVAAQSDAESHLLINELMQSNVDGIMDDLNDFPDSWVELYNPGSQAVALASYSLGITPDASQAWPLPARTVKAGGSVLVYCDKVANGLHTPFRLESGKGGAVYLFLNGQLADQLTGLAKQPAPNIAYGRSSDGAQQWGYELTPTPGAPNCGGVCDGSHLLGSPLFSRKGSVTTSHQTFTLSLSLPAGSPEGTQIRYTTNGTEPTSASPVYTGPISVSSTRVVRARLFCTGWLSPPSVTHSYIFFPRQLTLPVVSVVTDNRYLNNNTMGILANNTDKKRVDWRRPINLEYFTAEDVPASINQLCETRVAGAASRGAAKKSLALYANKRFGTKRFQYEFFPDQRPGLTDYKSLVLRNAGNDFDYLYMRDAVAQRTMATYTDIDWQAWQPAIIYINGSYYGMLNIRERANENNILTNYDGLEDIDLIENWYDLKEGTWDNYNSFKAFYTQSGHTMAQYEELMDCREFINLMLMNLYFDNVDFPGNNIVMWRPRAEGGRWRWVAKDVDFAMGIYNTSYKYKTLEWLYNPNYDKNRNWGANSTQATLLFRQLMDDRDFNREFIDRCAVYMGDFLNQRGIRAVWDPMYELIKYEYPNHRKLINQWWPNYDTELGTARSWVANRTAEFYAQLGSRYGLGTPIPMTVNKNATADNELDSLSICGIPLSGTFFDGYYYPGRQFTVQGTPPQGIDLKGWRVVKVASGKATTTETDGATLSMTMPQCSSLVIMAKLEPSNPDGIIAIHSPQWSCTRTDSRQLLLTDVPPQTTVSLYSLRGILLQRIVASGQSILLPAPAGQFYLLQVGGQTVKVR